MSELPPASPDCACYIHVGMAKTGTTSIQGTLQMLGAGPGYAYMNIGVPNHSGPIYAAFSSSPEEFHFFRKRGWNQTRVLGYVAIQRKKIEADIRANLGKNFIISGETIPRLTEQELAGMKEFFGRFFPKIYIVAYLRTPKSYMESIFQQRIKGGASVMNGARVYPKYRAKFEKFENVFGRENVLLHKFDPAGFPQKDVVLDFCQRLGITLTGYEPVRSNESLSLEAVALLYAFRNHGGDYGTGPEAVWRNRKIVEALRKIKGRKFGFSPAMVAKVIKRNAADLEWIHSRVGYSLAEDFTRGGAAGVASPKELLSHSMKGALMFRELLANEFQTGTGKIRNPRDAAQVLHDFAKSVPQRGEHPEGKREEEPPADPAFLAHLSSPELPLSELLKLHEKECGTGVSAEERARQELLLRGVFSRINQRIATSPGLATEIEGLGTFVKKLPRLEEGSATAKPERILFRPAPPEG